MLIDTNELDAALKELHLNSNVLTARPARKLKAAVAIPEDLPRFYTLDAAFKAGWTISGRVKWGYWLCRDLGEVAIVILWEKF